MQANEMPLHNHTFMAYTGTDDANTTSTPGPTVVYGKAPSNGTGPNASASLKLYADPTSLVSLSPIQLGVAGASFPHNNMQPFLAINYVIALQGVFPPRG
jgi:microcystin-dependent protein